MHSTFQLAYLSEATRTLTKDEILAILEISRINNKKLGVTGLLAYNSGHFLQLLEGEETIVETLFDKISKDLRHMNVKRVYEGVSHKQLFGQWSMAYKHIDSYSLSLRNRMEDLVGIISRGEMLYNSTDIIKLFEELEVDP